MACLSWHAYLNPSLPSLNGVGVEILYCSEEAELSLRQYYDLKNQKLMNLPIIKPESKLLNSLNKSFLFELT